MPLLLQWIKKTMENVSFSIVFLAHPTGIEPVTARIGIWCAIQLRHGCIYKIYDYSICFPAPNQALFHFSPKRAKQNIFPHSFAHNKRASRFGLPFYSIVSIRDFHLPLPMQICNILLHKMSSYNHLWNNTTSYSMYLECRLRIRIPYIDNNIHNYTY